MAEHVEGQLTRPRAEWMPLDEGVQLFDAASALGYRAIPALLDYALHPVLGRESLKKVIALLESARAIERLWLDRRIRRSSGWGIHSINLPTLRGKRLDPDVIKSAIGGLPRAAWWLFSMAPDGRLREEAIAKLNRDGQAMSLAHLLLRSLDWVRQVRKLAISTWETSLVSLQPQELIPLAPLITHLDRGTWQERAVYDTPVFARLEPAVLERYLAAFNGIKGEEVLLRAIRRGPAPEARACFTLFVSRRPLTPASLDVMLQSADVTIQRTALSLGLAASGDLRARAIDLASNSAFAQMRVRALQNSYQDDQGHLDSLRAALFDKAESVREAARIFLRQKGEDPAPAYRDALEQMNTTRTAVATILALADLQHNWMVASDFLSDSRPQVRAAAALAIGRSDREVARETLPALLGDDSPAVARAARIGLDRTGRISLEALSPFLNDQRIHVWRNAARLLHRTGTWPWLLASLRLASSDDPVRSQAGTAQLRRWSTRLYVPYEAPAGEVREQLTQAAVGVSMVPWIVLESFIRYGLALPEFIDLVAGSREALEVAARDVARAFETRLVKRYGPKHGGWYLTSQPDPRPGDIQETIEVSQNRAYDLPAEPRFTQWPTLVYVRATTRPELRAGALTAIGLSMLRAAPTAGLPSTGMPSSQ